MKSRLLKIIPLAVLMGFCGQIKASEPSIFNASELAEILPDYEFVFLSANAVNGLWRYFSQPDGSAAKAWNCGLSLTSLASAAVPFIKNSIPVPAGAAIQAVAAFDMIWPRFSGNLKKIDRSNKTNNINQIKCSKCDATLATATIYSVSSLFWEPQLLCGSCANMSGYWIAFKQSVKTTLSGPMLYKSLKILVPIIATAMAKSAAKYNSSCHQGCNIHCGSK